MVLAPEMQRNQVIEAIREPNLFFQKILPVLPIFPYVPFYAYLGLGSSKKQYVAMLFYLGSCNIMLQYSLSKLKKTVRNH